VSVAVNLNLIAYRQLIPVVVCNMLHRSTVRSLLQNRGGRALLTYWLHQQLISESEPHPSKKQTLSRNAVYPHGNIDTLACYRYC